MRGNGARALIVASRALSEAVGFAAAAAVLHAVTLGREAFPLLTAGVALAGITLILLAVLRERGTVRQSTGLAGAVIVASIAWGLTLPSRAPDALAVLTRIVGFAILAEIYLWRVLSLARGLQRWREVRADAVTALLVVIVAALWPGPVDRDALPVLGLAVALAGAVALSLSRSAEELELSGGQVRGRPAPSAATGTAFALGVLAIVVSFVLPAAQRALAALAAVVGPVLGEALFYLLLPLGYLAAYMVFFVQWLRSLMAPGTFEIKVPVSPFSPDEDAQRLADLEASRPYLIGAIEVLIGLVVVLVAVVLIARLVQERRAVAPEGTLVEREGVVGIGFRDMLGALLPRRAAALRPPADDGTAATAVRRLYWRLLDLAEAKGPGRRASAETPAEHEVRLVGAAVRWSEAGAVVRAFERVRYGEREPGAHEVQHAREALRAIEATR